MYKNATITLLLLLIPAVVAAQVIFPNRGGTGLSEAPADDDILLGNGSSFDLKTLTAGSNVTFSETSGALTISASLEGGGLATTDIDTYNELNTIVEDVTLTHNGLIDTEAELEAILGDVSNLFTNNDTIDISSNTNLAGDTEIVLTGNTLSIASTIARDSELHDAVTISGEDYLSLSGQQITVQGIDAANLAAADFGDFSCNGTTCSLDTTYLTGNETITLSGDITGSGATAITTTLAADAVADNEIDYTSVTLTDFTNDAGFITSANDTVSDSELDGVFSTTGLLTRTGVATYSTITDNSGNWNTAYSWGNHATQGYLTTVDVSDDTNLTAGTGLTLTGDTLSNDLGSSITGSEIDDDTITNANIADADQADSKCLYLEDPTADDDLQSIWSNKTANDFLLTEIWAESDQTVNFDLQVDDGTPTDVNGTDISPSAGEAEDTSLSGDTTVAAGEELDLAVTSVSGTPTWVSICWTGNWVD